MKYGIIAARILLALPMIVFGANKLFGFMEMDAPEAELPVLYMSAMFSTYLGKLVGITEVIGGILLLPTKTSALGAIVLLPVLINIVLYHLTVDVSATGIGMGGFLSVLALGILVYNKNRLLPIIGDPR